MQSENKPIFIVGSPRSGTSLLTWCLGQHPNVLPLPETHWIARLSVHMRQLYRFGSINGRYSHLGALDWTEKDFYAELGRTIDQFIVNTREPRLQFIRKLSRKECGFSDEKIREMEKKGNLSPDPVLVSAKNYQVIRSSSDPKRRWVDGTPENTFYMYSLSTLFPEAVFIHLLRNPSDVARSLMNFSQAGGAGLDHREAEAFLKWQKGVEYAVKGEQALGKEKVLRINYEELVADSEKTLRKCFNFLGEEFNSDCLLPIQQKVNSSKVGNSPSQFKLSTSEGKVANDFYQKIYYKLPGASDAKIFSELVDHYEKYADQINV